MQIVNSKQIHANPHRFYIVGMCRKGDTSWLATRSHKVTEKRLEGESPVNRVSYSHVHTGQALLYFHQDSLSSQTFKRTRMF